MCLRGSIDKLNPVNCFRKSKHIYNLFQSKVVKDQVVSIMKFKVVLLGEANVGKTAIVNRFVRDSFDQGETKCKPDLQSIGSSPVSHTDSQSVLHTDPIYTNFIFCTSFFCKAFRSPIINHGFLNNPTFIVSID